MTATPEQARDLLYPVLASELRKRAGVEAELRVSNGFLQCVAWKQGADKESGLGFAITPKAIRDGLYKEQFGPSVSALLDAQLAVISGAADQFMEQRTSTLRLRRIRFKDGRVIEIIPQRSVQQERIEVEEHLRTALDVHIAAGCPGSVALLSWCGVTTQHRRQTFGAMNPACRIWWHRISSRSVYVTKFPSAGHARA